VRVPLRWQRRQQHGCADSNRRVQHLRDRTRHWCWRNRAIAVELGTARSADRYAVRSACQPRAAATDLDERRSRAALQRRSADPTADARPIPRFPQRPSAELVLARRATKAVADRDLERAVGNRLGRKTRRSRRVGERRLVSADEHFGRRQRRVSGRHEHTIVLRSVERYVRTPGLHRQQHAADGTPHRPEYSIHSRPAEPDGPIGERCRLRSREREPRC
jgi:hypothetical protein